MARVDVFLNDGLCVEGLQYRMRGGKPRFRLGLVKDGDRCMVRTFHSERKMCSEVNYRVESYLWGLWVTLTECYRWQR